MKRFLDTSAAGVRFRPVTGERVVFLEGVGDPSAPRLTFDFYLRPGGGVLVPHQHLRLTETLHVRSGALLAGPPGQERLVGPGESITFTPGQGHVLKNAGEGELHAFTDLTPAGSAESFLRNDYGLYRDGFAESNGELPLPALASSVRRAARSDLRLKALVCDGCSAGVGDEQVDHPVVA